MKDRNFYGKKMTQFTRRHKHPITVHKIVWYGYHHVIKEYHGSKIFLYLSNPTFSELYSFATPMTKSEFKTLINDFTLNPYTAISSWETETIK